MRIYSAKANFLPLSVFAICFQDSREGVGGRFAPSFQEDGNGIRRAGTRVDLIGSRERGRINKIYLAWNTGILYRVDKSHGHPVDKAPPFIAPTR